MTDPNPPHTAAGCRRANCGQCRLIAKDPAFRAAFHPPTPSATTTPARRAAAEPCPLRSAEPVDSVECPTCAGRVTLKVYGCEAHGRCTIGTPAPGVRGCCAGCPDRPRPDPHPGEYLSVPEPPADIITARPTSPRVVVTAVVGDEAERMHAASGPSQAAFARSIGADYLALRWNPLPGWPMACKFGMWAALAPGLWESLLWLDTDALPLPGCVNPFDLTAPGRVGVYDERPFHIVQPEFDCETAFDRFRARMGGPVERPVVYFNAGVMVVPATARGLVAPPTRLWVEAAGTGRHCAEQNLLNLRLASGAYPYQLLDRRANWQGWPAKGLIDAPADAILHWSGGPERHRRAERMAERAAARPWPNGPATLARQSANSDPSPAPA
ncbi:MAG: hypothetical protein U0804_28640 [Gemmataceae bacterium]